jgi:hypothetical protein
MQGNALEKHALVHALGRSLALTTIWPLAVRAART